jgi:sec-independent protein translocase protein TatA
MNIFGLGAPELLVIAFLLLLFFGKDRLPDLARGLGRSIRELRDGLKDTESPKEAADKQKNTK